MYDLPSLVKIIVLFTREHSEKQRQYFDLGDSGEKEVYQCHVMINYVICKSNLGLITHS